MRTTVTLDDDVAATLRELARKRNISFKEALNTSVRLGTSVADRSSRPYRVPTRPLGLRQGIDLDKALRLADELEDGDLVRKLELRK
ncbi:MAG: ribbon-helix-helix protein, CopG family [Solirubrobacteraceae bacterium]